MATSVVINGTTFSIPEQSDPAPWGEAVHDVIEALVVVANATFSTGDISKTNFTVNNNVSIAADVTGLSFDPAIIRSATITYSVYRSTSTTELSEHGQLFIAYKSTANTWELSNVRVGDAGLTFSVLSTGQLQFISTNLSGINYNSLLKFEARAFTQT